MSGTAHGTAWEDPPRPPQEETAGIPGAGCITALAVMMVQRTAISTVPRSAMTRPRRPGATLLTRATTAVAITVPPPAAATTLTAARLAPPLRKGPRGGGVRPIDGSAVPRVRTRPGVCAMTPWGRRGASTNRCRAGIRPSGLGCWLCGCLGQRGVLLAAVEARYVAS